MAKLTLNRGNKDSDTPKNDNDDDLIPGFRKGKTKLIKDDTISKVIEATKELGIDYDKLSEEVGDLPEGEDYIPPVGKLFDSNSQAEDIRIAKEMIEEPIKRLQSGTKADKAEAVRFYNQLIRGHGGPGMPEEMKSIISSITSFEMLKRDMAKCLARVGTVRTHRGTGRQTANPLIERYLQVINAQRMLITELQRFSKNGGRRSGGIAGGMGGGNVRFDNVYGGDGDDMSHMQYTQAPPLDAIKEMHQIEYGDTPITREYIHDLADKALQRMQAESKGAE